MEAWRYFAHVREVAATLDGLGAELCALIECDEQCLSHKTKGDACGHGVGTTSDPTARMAEARLSMPERIASARRAYDNACDEVGEALSVIHRVHGEVSPLAAEALELWAVDRAPTWTDVASELHVSYKTVARARDKAYTWLDSHSLIPKNYSE